MPTGGNCSAVILQFLKNERAFNFGRIILFLNGNAEKKTDTAHIMGAVHSLSGIIFGIRSGDD